MNYYYSPTRRVLCQVEMDRQKAAVFRPVPRRGGVAESGRGGLRKQASGRRLGAGAESSKYKYEKKRSAEDLLKAKKNSSTAKQAPPAAAGGRKGRQEIRY